MSPHSLPQPAKTPHKIKALKVAVGAVGALRRRRALSTGIYALAVLLVATPVLVAAYSLRTALGVHLQWFPLTGAAAAMVSVTAGP